jgi:phospholipase C
MAQERPGMSRRRFIRHAATGVGALAAGSNHALASRWPFDPSLLPAPEDSAIDHVVVVMMENRSFDHMLGWLPRADGRQAGLIYLDDAGIPHETYPLAPDYQGCGHPDPDHSYEGGRIEYNGGACDGWLRAGENDEYAIGYYRQHDLPFFSRAAADWTVCDRYFTSMMGPTFPNRFYQHAAQTDRIRNTFDLSTLPTIWDRLPSAGLTGRYYFSDAPFVALWGLKYLAISRLLPAFLADCAAGTLPHVSFVEPRFIDSQSGTSSDDHPHADIRNGQAFLNLIYRAVTTSPAWPRTVLVINYDEWGGFFEHVPPPTAPIPDQAAGNADGLLGFRVPCLVISPYARRKYISHAVFDHTSILKMIEWRWGLEPLTVRDGRANNLAEALDFSQPPRAARQYNVPVGPFGQLCAPFEPDKWLTVADIARNSGWAITP